MTKTETEQIVAILKSLDQLAKDEPQYGDVNYQHKAQSVFTGYHTQANRLARLLEGKEIK